MKDSGKNQSCQADCEHTSTACSTFVMSGLPASCGTQINFDYSCHTGYNNCNRRFEKDTIQSKYKVRQQLINYFCLIHAITAVFNSVALWMLQSYSEVKLVCLMASKILRFLR